jgi:hypothetical protein
VPQHGKSHVDIPILMAALILLEVDVAPGAEPSAANVDRIIQGHGAYRGPVDKTILHAAKDGQRIGRLTRVQGQDRGVWDFTEF